MSADWTIEEIIEQSFFYEGADFFNPRFTVDGYPSFNLRHKFTIGIAKSYFEKEGSDGFCDAAKAAAERNNYSVRATWNMYNDRMVFTFIPNKMRRNQNEP